MHLHCTHSSSVIVRMQHYFAILISNSWLSQETDSQGLLAWWGKHGPLSLYCAFVSRSGGPVIGGFLSTSMPCLLSHRTPEETLWTVHFKLWGRWEISPPYCGELPAFEEIEAAWRESPALPCPQGVEEGSDKHEEEDEAYFTIWTKFSSFIRFAGLVCCLWLVSTDWLCSAGPWKGLPLALRRCVVNFVND